MKKNQKQTNKKRPVKVLPLAPRKERRRLSDPVDRGVRLRMPGDR